MVRGLAGGDERMTAKKKAEPAKKLPSTIALACDGSVPEILRRLADECEKATAKPTQISLQVTEGSISFSAIFIIH